jgi:hypothetical protein
MKFVIQNFPFFLVSAWLAAREAVGICDWLRSIQVESAHYEPNLCRKRFPCAKGLCSSEVEIQSRCLATDVW